MTAPTSSTTAPAPPGTGSVIADQVAVAHFDGTDWSDVGSSPSDRIALTPASHVLHYGSACFEGLKAHRQPDGSVRPFRAPAHARRMLSSAARLLLPPPPESLFLAAIDRVVADNGDLTPDPPGSLYLRPTLIGTENDILAAGRPSRTATFFVVAAAMGNYFADRPLTLLVETDQARTVGRFGSVKCGANYAMALGLVDAARRERGADQILFAPAGTLEETGASNVMIVAGDRLITPALTDAFLHGVTRDSLLHIAPALGLTVEERDVPIDELVDLATDAGTEIMLTGTAAVVATVGTLLHGDRTVEVAGAGEARWARTLGDRLRGIQTGREDRPAGW